ncbi:MAG: transcriptional regulator [Pseudomonadota bacterium]
MSANLKAVFEEFAGIAAPVLNIQDEEHYTAALELTDSLVAEASDNPDEPLNAMIDLLAKAITAYESEDEALAGFEAQAHSDPADITMLRLLMDQHGLGVAGFPEIGDKSLVSRILSGSRNLTKQHIEKLSRRFGIEPGMFFESK